MKAAKTVLILVLSAWVGGAFADDGGATGPPKQKQVSPAQNGGVGGSAPHQTITKQRTAPPAAKPATHRR